MTTETDTAQADSDFSAGFTSARGNTPTETEPTKAETVEPSTTTDTTDTTGSPAGTEQSAAPVTPAEEAVKMIAGMSESDVKVLLDKVPGLEAKLAEELRKLHGRYGEVQGQLKQLLSQSTRGKKIEAGALKRLNSEFPEIASILAEDLSEILAPTEETPKPDQAKDAETLLEQRIAAALAKANEGNTKAVEAMEKKLLTIAHPDWLTVCNTSKFKEWMKTLPEDTRTKYLSSKDSVVAAEAFTVFKAWTPPQKKPEVKPTGKKQERLQRAITPQGDATPPSTHIDDDAAFESGFKQARAGR